MFAAIEFEDTLISDAEEADYDRMMDVNVRWCSSLKYEIRAMLAHGGGGSIVAVGTSSRPRAC